MGLVSANKATNDIATMTRNIIDIMKDVLSVDKLDDDVCEEIEDSVCALYTDVIKDISISIKPCIGVTGIDCRVTLHTDSTMYIYIDEMIGRVFTHESCVGVEGEYKELFVTKLKNIDLTPWWFFYYMSDAVNTTRQELDYEVTLVGASNVTMDISLFVTGTFFNCPVSTIIINPPSDVSPRESCVINDVRAIADILSYDGANIKGIIVGRSCRSVLLRIPSNCRPATTLPGIFVSVHSTIFTALTNDVTRSFIKNIELHRTGRDSLYDVHIWEDVQLVEREPSGLLHERVTIGSIDMVNNAVLNMEFLIEHEYTEIKIDKNEYLNSFREALISALKPVMMCYTDDREKPYDILEVITNEIKDLDVELCKYGANMLKKTFIPYGPYDGITSYLNTQCADTNPEWLAEVFTTSFKVAHE